MVRIPEEYQEVEYIESTGTQYIELPFGFLDTDEIKIVGCEMTMKSDKFMVAPLRWETARRFAMIGSYGSKFVVGFSNKATSVSLYSPQQASDTKVHIWTYKNKIFSIIDLNAFYEWQGGSITQATANLRLFYGYNSPSIGRIYSYYHKKADENEINLIPCYRKSDNEIGMYDTVSKTFYTNSGTDTFLKGHNVYYNDVNLLEQRRKILLNTPHLKTIQDNIATFNTDIKFPLKECKIYFTPKQEGSGDPSPENIRSISGWDEINIIKTGKNLLNLNDTNKVFTSNNYKNWTLDNNVITISGLSNGGYVIPCSPNTTYTYSFNYNANYDGALAMRVWENKEKIVSTGISDFGWSLTINDMLGTAKGVTTFTTKADTHYLLIGFYAYRDPNIILTELQLELSDTRTSYEPYNGTEINIPFSQPIYGGYVDLIKGEIVSEYCTFILDGVNNYVTRTPQITKYGMAIAYSAFADNTYKGLENLPKGNTSLISQIKSNKYVIPINNNGGAASQQGVYFGGSNNNLYLRVAVSADKIPDTSTQTNIKNGINAWLQENPIQITYKMAEPIIYSLTPQNIIPFKGINNIFSDANGNIKIKFLAH